MTEYSLSKFAFLEHHLKSGEKYAGLMLGKSGESDYHLFLMSEQKNNVTFNQAKEFVASFGGDLPTRCEQSLLFANLKEFFAPRAYWSCEEHLSKEFAWCQHFSTGTQDYNHKLFTLRARAVRKIYVDEVAA